MAAEWYRRIAFGACVLIGASCRAAEGWTKLNLSGGNILQMQSFPDNHKIMLAIVDQHGLYRSTDRGDSWSQAFDDPFYDISVSVDNRAYAAGEKGLLFSDDFGGSWSVILSQRTWQVVTGGNGIVAADTMTLAKYYWDEKYRKPWLISADYGNVWASWKGTEDVVGSSVTKRQSIVFHENGEVFKIVFGDVYKCDKNDWTRWALLGNVSPDTYYFPVEPYFIPSDSDSVIYAYAALRDFHPGGMFFGGVFQSADLGLTWKRISSESVTALNRRDDRLFIGSESGDLSVFDVNSQIEKIIGRLGGAITSIDSRTYHEKELIVSTKGGIFKTNDDGENWRKSDYGIFDAEVNSVQIVPLDDAVERIVVSTKNSGILISDDDGRTWSWTGPAVSTVPGLLKTGPPDSQRLYACGHEIHMSDDAGKSWRKCEDFPAVYYNGWYGRTIDVQVDPLWSDRIVVSYYDHSRDDYRGNVSAISRGLPDGGLTWETIAVLDSYRLFIERFQFDVGRNRLWASYAAGYRGESKPKLIVMNAGADSIIAEICTPDSISPDLWCAAGDSCFLFNADKNRIWFTTDLGAHWTSVDLQLKAYVRYEDWAVHQPLGQLEFSPNRRFLFLLYPGNGVLVSEDCGLTWKESNAGLGSLSAYQISFSPFHRSTAYLAAGDGVYKREIVSGLAEEKNIIEKFRMDSNYPNPFNSSTVFSFYLPGRTRVTMRISDILGREVEVLLDRTMDKGTHVVRWTPRDLPSGVYLCRFKTSAFGKVFKVMLMK